MSGFHNAYADDNNENITPNIPTPSSNIENNSHKSPNIPTPSSNIAKMKETIDKYSNNDYHYDTLKHSLKPILKHSSMNELREMYDFANSRHHDTYEDTAKILESTIERREEGLAKKRHTIIKQYDDPDDRINVGINRQLKALVDDTNKNHNMHKNKTDKINTKFVQELIKLTDAASNKDLVSAYKYTLVPTTGDTKPGFSPTSKILDDILENKGLSRNSHGRVIDRIRVFGTPHKRLSHKKSSHHGGSNKKTKKVRRRPLTKSKRVKKRKTMKK